MKKITVKEFFATLFGGLWQGVLWVIGLFGFSDNSKFWKVVKRIFAFCATLVLVVFCCAMVYEIYDDCIQPRISRPIYSEHYISNHIAVQHRCHTDKVRLYDTDRKKVLYKDIEWVATSGDKDSLAVLARNDRRGYINRFTGELVIPEIYTRAWVFSEGLAAVEKDGRLLFIDHEGKIVIDKGFQVYHNNPRYAFKNGYCMIQSSMTGRMGLIDKSGNWALNPEYDNLFNNEGFWQLEKDGCTGLLTADLDEMFPIENTDITINDGVIEVRHADHIARRYDYDGRLLVDFVIDEVENMLYETTELRQNMDEEDYYEEFDNKVYAVADCQRYIVRDGQGSEYCGLLNRKGEIVTKPVYYSIQPIGKGLYLCQPDGVILNNDGKRVN